MATIEEVIERVREIDSGAADYLMSLDESDMDEDVSCLSGMMVWADTEHGHNYWQSINDQLYEED